MKQMLLPILLLLLPVLLCAQDYRQVSWGMTVEEVIAVEGPDYTTETSKSMDNTITTFWLLYERPLIGMPAHLKYGFFNGQLDHSWHMTRPELYGRLLAALTLKYGEPDKKYSLGPEWKVWITDNTYICLSSSPDSDDATGYALLQYALKENVDIDRTKEDAEQL